MSKYNNFANEDQFRTITRDWTRRKCPLIWLYAPSNTGKTTMLGSLFPRDPSLPERNKLWTYQHKDYCKVLLIDADQGSTTIDHFTDDPRLAETRVFDRLPNQQLGWTYEQLDYACTADCNAIIIEGATSIHRRLVANQLKQNPGATGHGLRRCYISPATHGMALVDTILQIKQYRIAKGTGVPVFVTLNTKSQSIDPDNMDAGDRYIPAWSKNLIEASMGGSDGHMQLLRDATGTRFVTMESAAHPYCKMRSQDVAEIVQSQLNLNLPGLLTLWAVTLQDKANKSAAALDKQAAADHNQTPTG